MERAGRVAAQRHRASPGRPAQGNAQAEAGAGAGAGAAGCGRRGSAGAGAGCPPRAESQADSGRMGLLRSRAVRLRCPAGEARRDHRGRGGTGSPPDPMIERFTFDRLCTALLFVAIATAACLMPAQHDTWWLLRAGQDIWHTRQVLLTDIYSHTAYGAAWPNHEWLSQLLFYAIYAIGGMPLLTLAAAAAVTAAWAIVWIETRGPEQAKFLMTAFVVATATTTWSLRAQVLSLLLVVATAALLRRRRYVWLPLLFWIWANLHGAVLLGVLLLAAALTAAIVEDRKAILRLAGATASCLVATALTPLGWRFWLDMPQSLGRIRQLGIDEWAAPAVGSLAEAPFWITIAALIVLTCARGRMLFDGEARREGRITQCA